MESLTRPYYLHQTNILLLQSLMQYGKHFIHTVDSLEGVILLVYKRMRGHSPIKSELMMLKTNRYRMTEGAILMFTSFHSSLEKRL